MARGMIYQALIGQYQPVLSSYVSYFSDNENALALKSLKNIFSEKYPDDSNRSNYIHIAFSYIPNFDEYIADSDSQNSPGFQNTTFLKEKYKPDYIEQDFDILPTLPPSYLNRPNNVFLFANYIFTRKNFEQFLLDLTTSGATYLFEIYRNISQNDTERLKKYCQNIFIFNIGTNFFLNDLVSFSDDYKFSIWPVQTFIPLSSFPQGSIYINVKTFDSSIYPIIFKNSILKINDEIYRVEDITYYNNNFITIYLNRPLIKRLNPNDIITCLNEPSYQSYFNIHNIVNSPVKLVNLGYYSFISLNILSNLLNTLSNPDLQIAISNLNIRRFWPANSKFNISRIFNIVDLDSDSKYFGINSEKEIYEVSEIEIIDIQNAENASIIDAQTANSFVIAYNKLSSGVIINLKIKVKNINVFTGENYIIYWPDEEIALSVKRILELEKVDSKTYKLKIESQGIISDDSASFDDNSFLYLSKIPIIVANKAFVGLLFFGTDDIKVYNYFSQGWFALGIQL